MATACACITGLGAVIDNERSMNTHAGHKARVANSSVHAIGDAVPDAVVLAHADSRALVNEAIAVEPLSSASCIPEVVRCGECK